MIKPCISIDWLQIHTKIIVFDTINSEKSVSGKYQIRVVDIHNRVFKQHREILLCTGNQNEICAVLSFEANSSILPKDSAHLKVINKFLYHSELKAMVDDLLTELNMRFHSISRMDVAADMKGFYKRSCNQFIAAFLTKKILKVKPTGFHLDGYASKQMPIHYLRFGSRRCPITFYIYNKSKELREKTDKPYIRERWALHGMKEKAYDVWRIEFVLSPSQYGLISTETSEMLDFKTVDVTEPKFVNDLFFTLLNTEAKFVINDGQVKKSRMKPVILIKNQDYKNVYQKVSEKVTSNRMDKVFIKVLDTLNNDWRNHNRDDVSVNDLLADFVDKKDLTDWYMQNTKKSIL